MNEQLELPIGDIRCTGCGKPDCGYVAKRKEPEQQLKFRTYDIMHRAIETGIAVGFRRAHKHTTDPGEESIRAAIMNEVMNELSDVIDWGDA